MIPTLEQLHGLILDAIGVLDSMGRDIDGLEEGLASVPPSYDAYLAFAESLKERPFRAGWEFVEPFAWDEVFVEMELDDSVAVQAVDDQEAARRIVAGFHGSVAGCQLGKCLEIHPTLAELRDAMAPLGQWPLDDYVTAEALENLGRRHQTGWTRGQSGPAWVDDDQNYTVLGMLVLEEFGPDFTHAQLRRLWELNLPTCTTWGPERRGLATWSVAAACRPTDEHHPLHDLLVYGDLWCGAQIRADAYGYACPGSPALAAELAYRDATLNHFGTGAYATAWTAAAIALAYVIDDPVELFRQANRYTPQRSRFGKAMAQALGIVERAPDWLTAYEDIHRAFGNFGHCRVLQESATLINTARFAESVGHGVCLQVMQGNDTDSYGATSGAILGVFFGPGHLEPRWLAPFDGRIEIGLAHFYETRIEAIAERLSRLPRLTNKRG